MIRRIATRMAGDNDLVSDLERFRGDPVARQYGGSGALFGPALLYALRVRGQDVNVRMRIAELELDDHAFDLYTLLREKGRDRRVMSLYGATHDIREQQQKRCNGSGPLVHGEVVGLVDGVGSDRYFRNTLPSGFRG